ncbi:hypothetical protein GEMRC1_004577 [Eukaryota sp. GEM-RC1]
MQTHRYIERKLSIPLPVVFHLLRNEGSLVKSIRKDTDTLIIVSYAGKPGLVLVRGPPEGVQNACFRILTEWDRIASKSRLSRIMYLPGVSPTSMFSFISYDPFLSTSYRFHQPHYVLQCIDSAASTTPTPLQQDLDSFNRLISSFLSNPTSIDAASFEQPPFRAVTTSSDQFFKLSQHFLSCLPATGITKLKARAIPGRVVFHSVDSEFLNNSFSFEQFKEGLVEGKFSMGFSPGYNTSRAEFAKELTEIGHKENATVFSDVVRLYTVPEEASISEYNTRYTQFQESKKTEDSTEDEDSFELDMPFPVNVLVSRHSNDTQNFCIRSSGKVICKLPIILSHSFRNQAANERYGCDVQVNISAPTVSLSKSQYREVLRVLQQMKSFQ